MPTVSDLKDQARALEQQGQPEKALAIYQHILKHLEGKPALVKVLPLYVKVGDLHLKLDRPPAALASYDRAAGHYAEHGSAPRVISLCEKIKRVDPSRTTVHAEYTRQLLEHGHVSAARDVLSEYAQTMGLDKAVEALDQLADRPNAESKPLLERLLDSIERGEPMQAEQAAERVSTQLQQITDSAAGELDDAPPEPPADEPSPEPPESERIETSVGSDVADAAAEEEASEPLTPHLIDLGFKPGEVTGQHQPLPAEAELERSRPSETHEPPAPVSDPEPEPETPADEPDAMDGLAAAFASQPDSPPEEDEDEAEPEPASEPAFDTASAETWAAPETSEPEPEVEPEPEPEPEPTPVAAAPVPDTQWEPVAAPSPDSGGKQRKPTLLIVGGFAIGLLGGLALAMSGLLPFGGGGDAAPAPVVSSTEPVSPTPPQADPTPPDPAPEPTPVVSDTIVAADSATDTLVVTAGATDSTTLAAAGAPPLGSADSAGLGVSDSMTSPADSAFGVPPDSATVPADSQAPSPALPSGLVDSAGAAPPAPVGPPVGNPIIVDGLAVESLTEIEFRGQAGFRVVQLLDWADPITIESYPMAGDTTGATRVGRVIVNVTPPDTVVGILRMPDHQVYASGVMPEDSLRSLMTRLVEAARDSINN